MHSQLFYEAELFSGLLFFRLLFLLFLLKVVGYRVSRPSNINNLAWSKRWLGQFAINTRMNHEVIDTDKGKVNPERDNSPKNNLNQNIIFIFTSFVCTRRLKGPQYANDTVENGWIPPSAYPTFQPLPTFVVFSNHPQNQINFILV